ncbi:MAG: hypothetical protein EAZ57_09410 [Cytophagales bacterium]|nr:MAG: hypothetical protein EAZ57_09410 [Cytophagales bacterium]
MDNNPVNLSDPTGKSASTHTDEEGNVIAVYDDGDNGVYRHKGDRAEATKNVAQNYNKKNTSASGEKMGESLHSLSFADQNLFNDTGEALHAPNMKIDFGSSELTDRVQAIIDAEPSLVDYAQKAGASADWDLKSKVANGSKLYGKYASPRDAGNFAAGAVAEMSGIEPIAQFGYGAYNLTGNDKILTAHITVAVVALIAWPPTTGWGLGIAYLIAEYGEDTLTQRSIDIGKEYIKTKK